VRQPVDALVRNADADTITVFLDRVRASAAEDLWITEIVPARRSLKRDLLQRRDTSPPPTAEHAAVPFRQASGTYATPCHLDDDEFEAASASYSEPSPPKPWGGTTPSPKRTGAKPGRRPAFPVR
jgi:hypothetical protein